MKRESGFPASRLFWAALVMFSWFSPGSLAAQNDRCVFQIDNVDRQGSVNETTRGTNYFAGGNVRLSCRGQQLTMQSDSVAAYGGDVVQFIGNVKYRDSTLTMDADRGTYYKNGEKWEARGRVVTKNLRNGSTLNGPAMDYFRVVKGVRDTMEMYSTGRPRIQYATASPGAQPGEPYIIVADRVRLKGSDRLWGGGKVTIDRSDFAAKADSLLLDTGKGDGTLVGGNPVMRGLGRDSFNISGRRLDLKLDHRELTYVTAKGAGHAASKQRDWIRGDTVVATFVQRDSAGTQRPALNRIVARKAAQSYHVEANARYPARPSINYARGDVTVMTMSKTQRGGVARVDIRGQVDGLQLEAPAPPAR